MFIVYSEKNFKKYFKKKQFKLTEFVETLTSRGDLIYFTSN